MTKTPTRHVVLAAFCALFALPSAWAAIGSSCTANFGLTGTCRAVEDCVGGEFFFFFWAAPSLTLSPLLVLSWRLSPFFLLVFFFFFFGNEKEGPPHLHL